MPRGWLKAGIVTVVTAPVAALLAPAARSVAAVPRGGLNAGIVTAVPALVAALAATPAQAAPTDVVASPVAAGASSPAATARYWTARRMREARPVEGTLSRS